MPRQIELETRVTLRGGALSGMALTRMRKAGEPFRPVRNSDPVAAAVWLRQHGYNPMLLRWPRQESGVAYVRQTWSRASV